MHASQGTEQDWNLLQTCISLLQHIGDFRLKMSELEAKITKAVHEKEKEISNSTANDVTQICTTYKITGKRELNDFQKLVDSAQVLSSYEQRGGIFFAIFDQIKPICEYIHDTTLASIFLPIQNQLETIQSEADAGAELSGNDLPDYSFAPQEFITVVGQVCTCSLTTNESMRRYNYLLSFTVFINITTTFGTPPADAESTTESCLRIVR